MGKMKKNICGAAEEQSMYEYKCIIDVATFNRLRFSLLLSGPVNVAKR